MTDNIEDLLDLWEESRESGDQLSISDFLKQHAASLSQHERDQLRQSLEDLEFAGDLLREDPDVTADHRDPDATADHHPAEQDRAARIGEDVLAKSNFKMLRFHAQGGIGEVHVATEERFGREVAVKFIRRHRSGDQLSQRRFEREARITSRLQHPGIVPVYGQGEDGEGRPFYAMRFVSGQTLQEAIEQFHSVGNHSRSPGNPLALQQLLRRLIQACRTVAYAHGQQVIHRDVKPSNILLGDFGETLVVDWGLAKTLDSPDEIGDSQVEPNATDATHAGSVLGTPAFMSPEQASGETDKIGPASDVYGLGASLYILATGRPPFEGNTPSEVIRQVQQGKLKFPKSRRSTVAGPIKAICRKAMALDPSDRYASASDLANDVERYLADEPVSAWKEPWTYPVRRWLARHRTWIYAGFVSMAVVLVILSVTAARLQVAHRQEASARLAAEVKEAEAQEARRVAEIERARARRGEQLALKTIAALSSSVDSRPVMEELYEKTVEFGISKLPKLIPESVKKRTRKELLEHPDLVKFLAAQTARLGVQQTRKLLLAGDRLREAETESSLQVYGRAIGMLVELASKEIQTESLQDARASAHHGRARAYELLERYDEALDDWDAAMKFADREKELDFRIARATCLARADRPELALEAAAAL
ncbi:MAG: protein kinase, partial [Planctomycetales bacterium]